MSKADVVIFDPLHAVKNNAGKIDPARCPLCHRLNNCAHHNALGSGQGCWCYDPEISFPESLLISIPPEQRSKACVCRDCAVKYQEEYSGKEGGI
ncbi:cysteine-rich CWC family protein [Oceanospirillum linum]|uniref:cysteine-rich CWC family protein n=1 Tax=Oceanospirillum linum TaxID=966 RepID=UPI00192FB63B|nr:cysteine-rich CWC family protein [Oceanospirillum linum]